MQGTTFLCSWKIIIWIIQCDLWFKWKCRCYQTSPLCCFNLPSVFLSSFYTKTFLSSLEGMCSLYLICLWHESRAPRLAGRARGSPCSAGSRSELSSFHTQHLKHSTWLSSSRALCHWAIHPSLGSTFLICKMRMIFKVSSPQLIFCEENRPNSNHTPTFHSLTHPHTKMGVSLFLEEKRWALLSSWPVS